MSARFEIDGDRLSFPDDVIERGIGSAIADGEFEMALDMLRLLTAQNPKRAHEVLQVIEVGLRIATEKTAS